MKQKQSERELLFFHFEMRDDHKKSECNGYARKKKKKKR